MRPEQLEYTLAGHPCLAQYPVLDTSTAAASPVPIVPTTPGAPDPANDQGTNSQATLVPFVPCVPGGEWRSTRLRMCRRVSLGRPLCSYGVAR